MDAEGRADVVRRIGDCELRAAIRKLAKAVQAIALNYLIHSSEFPENHNVLMMHIGHIRVRVSVGVDALMPLVEHVHGL